MPQSKDLERVWKHHRPKASWNDESSIALEGEILIGRATGSGNVTKAIIEKAKLLNLNG